MAYLGALLNNQNTNLQLQGYWQWSMAVPRVPGLLGHVDIEDFPSNPNGQWTSEIDLDIWTDAGGVEHMLYGFSGQDGASIVYQTSSASGFDPSVQHIYGWDWEANTTTFYVDGVVVGTHPTPTDGTYGFPMFSYILTAANYQDSEMTAPSGDPSPGSLPASVSFNCFEVYTTNPQSYTCH
jgi:beta-glucanase (GH16 family)